MKTIGAIGILAVMAVTFTGCDMKTDINRFNVTMCPTNHWKVVAVGADSKVMVQTESTNLVGNLQTHLAEPVGSLTNGQPVRVEMVIRHNPQRGGVDIISSKAYPSWQ